MPSECFTVNYLGARAAAVGVWQQAFPLGGCSRRAGGSLSTGTSAQSQSTQNRESSTQQLRSRGASFPSWDHCGAGASNAPKTGSPLTSPGGDER